MRSARHCRAQLIAAAVVSLVPLASSSSLRAQESAPHTGPEVELWRASIPAGLEAALPRHGAFEEALRAVRDQRYREAGERFADAAGEVRQSLRRGPASTCPSEPAPALPRCSDGRVTHATARALLGKIGFLASEARLLADDELLAAPAAAPAPVAAASPPPSSGQPHAPAHRAAPVLDLSYDVRLRAVLALHNLYLTDRAFHRRSDPVLWKRTAAAYDVLLALPEGARHVRTALAHAGLYADAGARHEALIEFGRVPAEALVPDFVDLVAHYYAAMGDPDRAFDALAAARDALPDSPEIRLLLLVANDLDPLRDDPRFTRLLGP